MASIRSITLAADDVDRVAAFYNAVIDAGLEPLDQPSGFHRGAIGQVGFVICPNSVAGVIAEQNRQQLSIEVDDVRTAYEAGLASGGQVVEPGLVDGSAGVRAWLTDPDGNSLELVERLRPPPPTRPARA